MKTAANVLFSSDQIHPARTPNEAFPVLELYYYTAQAHVLLLHVLLLHVRSAENKHVNWHERSMQEHALTIA